MWPLTDFSSKGKFPGILEIWDSCSGCQLGYNFLFSLFKAMVFCHVLVLNSFTIVFCSCIKLFSDIDLWLLTFLLWSGMIYLNMCLNQSAVSCPYKYTQCHWKSSREPSGAGLFKTTRYSNFSFDVRGLCLRLKIVVNYPNIIWIHVFVIDFLPKKRSETRCFISILQSEVRRVFSSQWLPPNIHSSGIEKCCN